jgi:hypothetical protein
MSNAILDALVGHERIMVRTWLDELLCGLHPLDEYVYWCWTPVLGTLCVAVGQRLALWADDAGIEIDLHELAAVVGHPGSQGGKHSPMVRTIARLCRFGFARCSSSGVLEVRTMWPSVPARLVNQLPPSLQAYHFEHAAAGYGSR